MIIKYDIILYDIILIFMTSREKFFVRFLLNQLDQIYNSAFINFGKPTYFANERPINAK